MITLFDERDLVSFGMYMISEQRKDSIKNNPEITNNEARKAILKTVTQFDFNNWLALKLKDDRESMGDSENPAEVINPEDIEEVAEIEDNPKIVPLNPTV